MCRNLAFPLSWKSLSTSRTLQRADSERTMCHTCPEEEKSDKAVTNPVRPRKRIKCEHGREPDKCKEECGGSSFCQHGRQRSRCQKCAGSGLCKHGRERAKCRSAEEVASVSTGGQTATNARSAFRKSVLDVLCLTMRILVCKAEWLSSVRKKSDPIHRWFDHANDDSTT